MVDIVALNQKIFNLTQKSRKSQKADSQSDWRKGYLKRKKQKSNGKTEKSA